MNDRARATLSFTGQSVDRARRTLAVQLKSAGIESAELDARLLAGAALGLDLTGLIAHGTRHLSAEESLRLEQYAARRLAGEPVARILGAKEFWGLPLKLSAATLVPRPDTETVVELALEILRGLPISGRRLRIVDIGTGTGAILLALLHETRDAIGIGTDASPEALRTAKQNAIDLKLKDRAVFVACNYAAAVAGPVDLVVSNPPYIRSADIKALPTEVRDYDPHLALDGGRDGLDAYRALIPQAAKLLGPGGGLVVEAGQGQAREIETLMTAAELVVERPARADLAGILRAVAARKMPHKP